MGKPKNIDSVLKKFIKSQDKLAKKYGVKISIGTQDHEVVIADHRNQEEKL